MSPPAPVTNAQRPLMPFMSFPFVLDSDRTREDQVIDLGTALALVWRPHRWHDRRQHLTYFLA
jgi:hypothetical protein